MFTFTSIALAFVAGYLFNSFVSDIASRVREELNKRR